MIESKIIVERYFDSITGKSDTPLSDHFADTIIWTLPPAHPFGGPFIGKAAVMEMMTKGGHLFQFDTMAIDIHALFSDNDNVAAHFSLTAKTADNRDYHNDYFFRFLCSDRKIIAIWEFLDTYRQFSMGMYDETKTSI